MESKPEETVSGCCSSQCDCGGGMDRRGFLKTAGAGALSISALGPKLAAGAEGAAPDAPKFEDLIPPDKGLKPDWVRGLFEKGAAEVSRGKELDTIGMPVGGIGAGQLYLLGDGRLGSWQIFNKHIFSGYGAKNYESRTSDAPVAQGFAVVVQQDGQKTVRALDRRGFPGVEFVGEYPIGRVRYAADGFPVQVELEAFSPFIPLNAKDSTLPATLFHFTVENRSERPATVSILGWLENAVCFYSAAEVRGLRRTRIVQQNGRTLFVHSAEEDPSAPKETPREPITLADFEGGAYGEWKATGEAFGDKPAPGTLGFQQKVSGYEGKGLVNTYYKGDPTQGTLTSPVFKIQRRFINFLIGGGSHKDRTTMRLLIDGKAVRSAVGRDDEKLEWRSWDVNEFADRDAQIEIVDKESGAWGHINVDQIEQADTRRTGQLGPLPTLEDFGTMVLGYGDEAANAKILDGAAGLEEGLAFGDVAYAFPEKRKSAMLSGAVVLQPGEKHVFPFVLAWHFPNHPNGHEYAGRFSDAAAVAHYVLHNRDRLAGDTRRWHATYYDSTLPHWLLNRLHSTVSNLATGTCQYWRTGRFWAWEGVGCCQGTCTHVWNYAHALARLFPELERTIREGQDLGVALHDNGLIGFRGERNGAYAADGQAGSVLKCYREHTMSPDEAFLRRNWPDIKRALSFSIEQDANDDGLIENSQHNTYDINFFGPNTFVGALYLAAVRAGEEMAREIGDAAFADRLRRIFESGSKRSVERLWNGEYFIHETDLKAHPADQYADGCLCDQMFGQNWAHQLALGYLYPSEHVKTTLRSIWKYNWTPDVTAYNKVYPPERWFVTPGEGGLFICTWPKSTHLDKGVRYRDEVWTGCEYQVAAHMIWEGMLDEALVMIRAVHDRYRPAKHNPWNEIECGDHYARAMASWGAFTALAGFEYHGPKGRLAFAPKIAPEKFRAAFTAAEGWGTFDQTREGARQRDRIEVRWGRLRLNELALQTPEGAGANVAATLNGQAVQAASGARDGRLVLTFTQPLVVNAGEALEVAIG